MYALRLLPKLRILARTVLRPVPRELPTPRRIDDRRKRQRRAVRAYGVLSDEDFACEPCTDRHRLQSAFRYLRESLRDWIRSEWKVELRSGRYVPAEDASDQIVFLLLDLGALDLRLIARRMQRL